MLQLEIVIAVQINKVVVSISDEKVSFPLKTIIAQMWDVDNAIKISRNASIQTYWSTFFFFYN